MTIIALYLQGRDVNILLYAELTRWYACPNCSMDSTVGTKNRTPKRGVSYRYNFTNTFTIGLKDGMMLHHEFNKVQHMRRLLHPGLELDENFTLHPSKKGNAHTVRKPRAPIVGVDNSTSRSWYLEILSTSRFVTGKRSRTALNNNVDNISDGRTIPYSVWCYDERIRKLKSVQFTSWLLSAALLGDSLLCVVRLDDALGGSLRWTVVWLTSGGMCDRTEDCCCGDSTGSMVAPLVVAMRFHLAA